MSKEEEVEEEVEEWKMGEVDIFLGCMGKGGEE